MASSNLTDVPADAQDIPQDSLYGYVPTMSVCIIFISLFTVCTVIHAAESFYWRIRWLLPTACFAGIMEVLGWSARLWSSISPLNRDPYIMQLAVTIIAPSPLVGALFLLFERISERLGAQYGRLSPKWYARIFLTCDIISLIVQGVGGGLAGSADDDRDQLDLGGDIMLGGIIFQLTSITVFVILMAEYFLRYSSDRPTGKGKKPQGSELAKQRPPLDTRMQLMIFSLVLMTIFLILRSIYRTVELIDGFDGPIIQTQVYFNVFDGGMIVLAMSTLNLLHPGYLLQKEDMARGKGYTTAQDPGSSESILLEVFERV
ncbi:RTA1-domain-containing protein [Cerioporus squamosus]|nr:RTA1-domain-containing protein [Cerioporus squamosus]